jgi:hypothetical protein
MSVFVSVCPFPNHLGAIACYSRSHSGHRVAHALRSGADGRLPRALRGPIHGARERAGLSADAVGATEAGPACVSAWRGGRAVEFARTRRGEVCLHPFLSWPYASQTSCQDLADWLGIGPAGLFNFKPSVRPVPLECHIQVRSRWQAACLTGCRLCRVGVAAEGRNLRALPAGV